MTLVLCVSKVKHPVLINIGALALTIRTSLEQGCQYMIKLYYNNIIMTPPQKKKFGQLFRPLCYHGFSIALHLKPSRLQVERSRPLPDTGVWGFASQV